MTNQSVISEALAALREEVRRLGERVAALEAAKAPPAAPTAPAEEKPPAPEPISEEVLLVISAAIAAFLGKKPHIRQIRLLGSVAWSQQGRRTIQASHALSTRHSRGPGG